MQRHKQSKNELISKLGAIVTDWKDEFSETFVSYLANFTVATTVMPDDLKNLLEKNFDAGITLFRLVLELSKDEFTEILKALFYDSVSYSYLVKIERLRRLFNRSSNIRQTSNSIGLFS